MGSEVTPLGMLIAGDLKENPHLQKNRMSSKQMCISFKVCLSMEVMKITSTNVVTIVMVS